MSKNGQTISDYLLNDILNYYVISKHAETQLLNRGKFRNRKQINDAIRSNILAYWNTDGTINIATDKFHYFVFGYKNNRWIMITYKEESHNGVDIFQKRAMAIKGKDRKLHNGK